MTGDAPLHDYLRAVRAQRSHTGKVVQFVRFLENSFLVTDTDYDLEQRAEDARLQIRGRIDTVVGDALFEFKTDLRRERNDAEEQLANYLAVFHARMPKRRCVGIATDGVQFLVYEAHFDADQAKLERIESFDLSKSSGEDALLWLDRYLFRRTPKYPNELDVAARFGAGSPTFRLTISEMQAWWTELKDIPSISLKFEVWARQLSVVYGEGVGSETLFMQHSYLAIVAKLLASVVFPQPALADETEILTGDYFRGLGIRNFIEEDLFSWMLHPTTRDRVSRLLKVLRSQLTQYEASGFDEDVLKGLYQGLVDPEVRHYLGEFYTPDWLADCILERTLSQSSIARILDPACGSGTFLFLAIRRVIGSLTEQGWTPTKILRHLEGNIVGIDVHPLAVLIARTNYLIACAPQLARRKTAFTVPVYLGDSLMYRRLIGTMTLPDIDIPADKETLTFPSGLQDDPELFDAIIARMIDAAERKQADVFRDYLSATALSERDKKILRQSLASLVRLFAVGRDSIWGFIIRNLIRPYVLSRGKPFDLVIGNPPWLSLRYVKSAEYQEFIKQQMAALNIKPEGGRFVSQLELATLFFAESARNYLTDGGTIAFVLPRSVLIHQQHVDFMRFRFGPFAVSCEEILDLDGVAPLFSVPACVIIARKGAATNFPIRRTSFSGRLSRKNVGWVEAKQCLTVSASDWSPARRPSGRDAPYLNGFRQGATLVPHKLWFVRAVTDSRLGVDPTAPLFETDASVGARAPWADVSIRGRVEQQAVYGTVLSTDLVPFRCVNMRPVVLPLVLHNRKPLLLSAEEAIRRGLPNLGVWLEKAEKIWSERKTSGSGSIVERLDHSGELRNQFEAMGRYIVLYVASAREMTAAVVDTETDLAVFEDKHKVTFAGLVVDHKVYRFATSSSDEAYYLCGWLNSGAVDEACRPRALFGRYRERNIEKRPVEIGPPKFDKSDARHTELSRLAKQAAGIVKSVAGQAPSGLAASRRAIRTLPNVSQIIGRIDEIAVEIGQLRVLASDSES